MEPAQGLLLAFFTQDLAQELDPDTTAVDTVTAYARRMGDINISTQDARGALGRLGLQGEKALRKVRDLSGGEKARVALAMFSLTPSNLYLVRLTYRHISLLVPFHLATLLTLMFFRFFFSWMRPRIILISNAPRP